MLPWFWVVIPAAGCGARMGADRPKQYLPLGDRTVIERTLDCFLDHPRLKGIVVSLAPDDACWETLDCAGNPRIHKAEGGRERADSVLSGLRRLDALGAGKDDWVLVHDAARPNLKRAELDRLLTELAEDAVGGLLAIPARDTLKRGTATGQVMATLERSEVWLAQTPQMFRLGLLMQAIAQAMAAQAGITDESSAVELMGLSPRLVPGRADNLKITCPEDMEWLRASLQTGRDGS